MRVILTTAQIRRIHARTVGTLAESEFEDWLSAECPGVRDSGRGTYSKFSVLMPPDAWLWVRDLLVTHTIRADGRRTYTEGRTSAWHTLTRIVVTAVNRRTAHPAFAGCSAVGARTEELVGWEKDGKITPFASLAAPGARFVTLIPYVRRVADAPITTWVEGPLQVDLALQEESAHLIFCRPVH